jgi:uncharacterized membrane protein
MAMEASNGSDGKIRQQVGAPKRSPLAPDAFEKALAGGALLLLIALLAALIRGRAEWGRLDLSIWLHLGTVAAALILTPILMLRRRGDRTHRRLGWAWALLMFGTALISFNIRGHATGQLSWIHLFSVLTILLVPKIIISARRHNIRTHRNTARNTVVGALLLAGFFTFPFERLLGSWLFGT